MQQVYWVKSSQTWTCPKSGTWKIICVGGGSSGGIWSSNLNVIISNKGGITSFGTILSANGGTHENVVVKNISAARSVGGFGGYDGVNYGGVPQTYIGSGSDFYISNATLNGGHYYMSGGGFGAGGASEQGSISVTQDTSLTAVKSLTAYPLPGMCGEMSMTICDMTQNIAIPCTIGQGGAIPTYNNALKQQIIAGGFTGYPTSVNGQNVMGIVAGKNGVIYLEYLG